MFGFLKKVFFVARTFFSCNLLNVNPMNAIPLKCLLMNNQECCKIRTEIVDINFI